MKSTSNDISLSQRSPLICGVNSFYVCGRLWPFVAIFFIISRVGLPAYLSNHNPFSREHIFVAFNEFSALVCWCFVYDLKFAKILFKLMNIIEKSMIFLLQAAEYFFFNTIDCHKQDLSIFMAQPVHQG